jgi:hypothetical protein
MAASHPLRPSQNFRPVRTCRPREIPLDVEFPTGADLSTSGGPSRCRISDQCGLFEHACPRYVIGRRGAVIVIPAAPAPAWQP